LKNRDIILSIKAEHYRNKVKEGNKNENNVVTVSKEIIISTGSKEITIYILEN
jgi:hypothetical protein